MGLLGGLSKKTQVKCLAQYLVLDKYSRTTSYYSRHHYALISSMLTTLFLSPHWCQLSRDKSVLFLTKTQITISAGGRKGQITYWDGLGTERSVRAVVPLKVGEKEPAGRRLGKGDRRVSQWQTTTAVTFRRFDKK